MQQIPIKPSLVSNEVTITCIAFIRNNNLFFTKFDKNDILQHEKADYTMMYIHMCFVSTYLDQLSKLMHIYSIHHHASN